MPNVNKVILVGHITRDPAGKHLPNGTTVSEFGIAVSERFTGKDGEKREKTCFIDCTSFGKQAEVINKFVRKGHPLYIEGRLTLDTWEDKNGGGKRSKHGITVERFEFLKAKEPGADNEAGAGPEF